MPRPGLPGERDLELSLVVLDLDLDLHGDLVGQLDGDSQAVPLHEDAVAGSELVRDRAERAFAGEFGCRWHRVALATREGAAFLPGTIS